MKVEDFQWYAFDLHGVLRILTNGKQAPMDIHIRVSGSHAKIRS
jgi:hypothetical protein